ncbi:hypothetical protein L596_022536 [Steinernema carpocapsae]|uniref:glucuronosyltransferase n=1 Tax=Steinernema carpocapsae TaxID=34508 RepID=A0A4V6A087_STECR|nr:hypothetical protein L596_022536 [Steinernema carpocapsae]
MHFLSIWVSLIAATSALKVAVFSSEQANSQVIWNKRVSEELLKDGHDVTLILIKAMDQKLPPIKIHPNVTVWKINAVVETTANIKETIKHMTFADVPMWDKRIRNSFNLMADVFVRSCEKLVQDKAFLKQVVDAKFDIAFAHMYEYCPIGLIHYAKIPTWIWLNSGTLIDMVAHDIGVESPPSYVPPVMSDSSDEMDFTQRFKSQIGQFIFPLIYPRLITNPETEVFRKHIDPNFPSLRELGKQCPLVMVNSNELYDLPRPILHKIVFIGGLGMKKADAKALEGDFKAAVDKAGKVVLMSFGSVANATDMPEDWKDALMNAFAKFPKVLFVMRYDGTDLKTRAPKNVLLSPWIPQTDLLQHPKTAAMISHGGYNTLQEVINAGKPVIMIPLFGEVSEFSVTAALEAVLASSKFAAAAQRLRAMVERKPIAPETLLRRWTAFLGEFQTLDNLVPHGTKLGFVQYHNLDVLFVMFAVSALILVVLFKILIVFLRLGYWVYSRSTKVKTL